MMIGAAGCLALEAFANTAATYTAGVTSLAGGKITFEYDGSDNITKMRMKPDYGETLTLTGDTLSFADGAQVVTSQQGTPVIANAISAAGSLRLGGVTNMAWSGSVFDRYTNPNWQTVLTNTRLDDIVPVSSTGCGNGGNGKTVYHPYWIVREGDTLRAEFQSFDSTYLYGVHLELQQDGDDIKARVISGGYINGAAYTNYLGISLFECPNHPSWNLTKDNTVARKYGFKQLTFGRRYETWDYCGNLLSDSYDTVVATNTSLEDVEILYATCNNGHTLTGWSSNKGQVTLYPHHVVYADGYLYAQFPVIDGTMTKCVKIRLRQSGSDVAARIVYAAYIDDVLDLDNDFDINYTRQNWAVITQEKFDAGSKQGYGLDTLALRSKAKDKLTFAVSGTLAIDMPIGGDDAEVTFEATSATATVNVTAQNSMANSAYIIKGDADHVMKFYAQHAASPYYPLPAGMTDVYGEGTELHIYGYNKMGNGTSGGESAITMHPGSKLYAENNSHAFYRGKQVLTLDASELIANKATYVPKMLTLSNGSTISGSVGLSAVYDQNNVVMNVTGTGASTFNPDVTLFSYNTTKREWEICVDDTVAGDDADFIFNGDVNLSNTANQQYSVIKKTGAGTMRMNGQMKYVNNATRICEGTLLLGKSDATVSGSKFSLEGGTLGLAANTANTVSSVSVEADSAIAFAPGATLTVTTLTLGSNVFELSITGSDGEYPITIGNRLDAETLAKIRLNGKRVVQAGNGRLVRKGLIIAFH